MRAWHLFVRFIDFIGIGDTARFLYRNFSRWYISSIIRGMLPKKDDYQEYNGVRVRQKRLGDDILIPERISDSPRKEAQYVRYIREYVTSGEKVTVIGGRYGISTVAAARQTAADNSVLTYEATKEGVRRVKETVALEGIENLVRVKLAAIGPVYGLELGTESIKKHPKELPECDTLAIDCDGCELEVVADMQIQPKRLIIEHHGMNPKEESLEFEYQRENLESILDNNGYEIIDETTQQRKKGKFKDRIGWFVAVQRPDDDAHPSEVHD